jgi:hypothetical protein
MAGYADSKVPRGTSRRWEVLMSDEERERQAGRRMMAIDVQADHRVLRETPEQFLRDVPLLEEGTTLTRRHEYMDFHDPARGDFRAEGTEVVKPGQRMVARDDCTEDAWRELREAADRVARRRPLKRAG